MDIRQKSIDAFALSADEGLDARMIGFLRQELPEQTGRMSDAELAARVTGSRVRARAIGVESEAGIAQFTCLTFLAGPAFDAIPEVKTFLTTPDPDDPDATVEDRLDELVDELSDDTE